MGEIRKIKSVYKSKPTLEGAGVHLKRAFGYHQVPHFDPFLLLDDFHSKQPDQYIMGFPWHPHRGIETITYVIHGEVEHSDSLGNEGIIHAGDVQWMTAGSGIIHQEMPKGEKGGLLWGFQLWANLPASNKMISPRYREVKKSDIPEIINSDGSIIKVISGHVGKTEGPVTDIVIEPEYLDISLPSNHNFVHQTNKNHTVIAYIIKGCAFFDTSKDPFSYDMRGISYFDMTRECLIREETLVHYSPGDHVEISTTDKPVRFLLISGKPLNEPVAWHGPIVMNTQTELQAALEEYQNGTFIKNSK